MARPSHDPGIGRPRKCLRSEPTRGVAAMPSSGGGEIRRIEALYTCPTQGPGNNSGGV
jgi:hypothetical protein